MAERGITVSYVSIRLWCKEFGLRYTNRLKCRHHESGDTFYLGEVIADMGGKQQHLWRAGEQDGEVVDVFFQARRDGATAIRFFKRLLANHQREPRKTVIDKLRSYGVAHRELIPETTHDTSQYAHNRAELSHQPARAPARGMRRLKLKPRAQRFLSIQSAVNYLFSLGRHLVSASHYRDFRQGAIASCNP